MFYNVRKIYNICILQKNLIIKIKGWLRPVPRLGKKLFEVQIELSSELLIHRVFIKSPYIRLTP